MKNLKKWILVMGLVGVMSISGCGNAKMSGENASADTADVTSSYSAEKSMAEEEMAEMDSADTGSKVEAVSKQKLIVTENLTVQTENFDSFMDTVNDKVDSLGGYIENSELSGTLEYADRYADLCIRIPAEKREDFVTAVDENGTVTYDSKSTQDVTLQYVDTESHLKALKTEEETLLSLLEKAEKLSDIFEIQQELTEVRYQIESYESQLRVYDNQVDYSTVNLTVHEVSRETTIEKRGFWSEAGADFINNLYGVGRFLRGLAIWLIGALPVLVVLAVIIGGVIWGIRRHHKKKLSNSKLPESNSTGSGNV